MNLILIFLEIYQIYAAVQTLENEGETFKYDLEKVSLIPQLDANVIQMQEKSLMSCAFHCQKFESPSFYYITNNSTCICATNGDSTTENSDVEGTILHGIKTDRVTTTYIIGSSPKETVTRIHKLAEPVDCLALFELSYVNDGVYVINPTGSSPTDVWCDMSNGGWTTIQRRQDGSEDFYRNWTEYKNGFGTTTGEYWLGLDNIYHLTIANSSLHIYLETFEYDNLEPFSAYAEYSIFKINDESDNYRLTVQGYSGSCNDSFSRHSNHQFSTIDKDNDNFHLYHCAQQFMGAWWYVQCHDSNLNGYYHRGAHDSQGTGINWRFCWGWYYSLRKTVMKIRRNN